MEHIPKIGILDSGVGGMSVLQKLLTVIPSAQYVYYADTANAPYGTKTIAELCVLAQKGIDFLQEHNVDSIVVACNTLSGKVVDTIKKTISIPIYSMIEHGYEHAYIPWQVENLYLFATQATIADGSYSAFLHKYYSIKTYHEASLPALVTWAERGHFEGIDIEQYIASVCDKVSSKSIVILGCTHYPLYTPIFSQHLPKDVTLYDPALSIAKQFQLYSGVQRGINTLILHATGSYKHIQVLCERYGISNLVIDFDR